LHDYLLSFVKRTQPLVDIQTKHREAEVEFDQKWDAGEFVDWEENKVAKRSANMDGAGEGLWCSACKSVVYLNRSHVFTLVLPGQKSYSKKTVYDAHLTSKKHLKATSKQAVSEAPPQNPNGTQTPTTQSTSNGQVLNRRLRNSALLTHLATSLLVILVPTISETKSNVERRFSLTAREREQELLEQAKPPPAPTNASGDAAAEEEEEERIYNPLKLPLGWDGKPIPYWLYKLHGLGVEYRCEICSDHVYMGRYAA
jgi:splicing factor 3A subunit 3